jgi:hypothetical protein
MQIRSTCVCVDPRAIRGVSSRAVGKFSVNRDCFINPGELAELLAERERERERERGGGGGERESAREGERGGKLNGFPVRAHFRLPLYLGKSG